jgi:hypothetical protein
MIMLENFSSFLVQDYRQLFSCIFLVAVFQYSKKKHEVIRRCIPTGGIFSLINVRAAATVETNIPYSSSILCHSGSGYR